MDREDEIETFLLRRSFLQRRFAEADRLEPPPEIDRIVLSRAREAIHVSEPPGIFRSARWALPFSLAAVLVLSFAVVLSVRLTPPPGDSSTYVAQTELATSSPAPTADRSFAATPGAPAPTAAPETMASRSALEPASEQATSQARRDSAPENDSPMLLANRATEKVKALPEPAAPASAPSAPSAPPSTGIVAMNRSRQQQDGIRIASADAAERSAPQRDEGRASNAASHAYSQLPPRASEAQAPNSASKARASAGRAIEEARNPEIWLKQIEQLRDNRMFAEAQREWSAFRKAYPNHPRVRRTREPASAVPPSSVAELAPPAEQPPSQPAR